MTKAFIPLLSAFIACVATGNSAQPINLPEPAKEDFSAVAKAVVDLLKSSHTSTFAESMAPSLADWRVLVPTNQAMAEDPITPEKRRELGSQRQSLARAARLLTDSAFRLKVDFSKLSLTAKVTPPARLVSVRYPPMPEEGRLPMAEYLDVVISAEPLPDATDADSLHGDYVIRLTDLVKFPSGWRCIGGLQWVSFPKSVADEKVLSEIALAAKASSGGELDTSDDPALAKLGEGIAKFLRKGDTAIYESDVALTHEALRSFFAMMAKAGRQPPTDAEIAEQWAKQHAKLLEPVKAAVELMEQQGIDLSNAELKVKQVTLKRASSRFASGTLEGMQGSGLRVVIAAESKQTSKTGKSLTGDYTLTAGQAMRLEGRWYVLDGLRLEGFPAGVVEEKVLANLTREAKIVESGYLPVGTIAPDIEFIRLSDEGKMKLNELRSKVVILDFWATWCGPCQEPMAKMQKYAEENPAWKDRVVVMSLSIDDKIETVRNHMEKRGWTNTFNTWAGKEAWESGAAKKFRVRGVPTCYVIDTEGKIVQAGHPAAIHAPDVVNRLLK